MQESTISLITDLDEPGRGEGVFRLSGLSSEWLFSSMFWQDINAKAGTMFDQYEEDEVDVSVAMGVAEALAERLRSLNDSSASVIRFVYGWSSSHEPLLAVIGKEQLLSELMGFHDFLSKAIAANRRISFSL